MNSITNQLVETTAWDERIVPFLLRHRMATNSAIQRRFVPSSPYNTAVKITSRLCRAGVLHKFPLFHPHVYFRLTERASRQCGGGPSNSAPLGPQALPAEFAALQYSIGGDHYHERLKTQEVSAAFPWMEQPSRHEIYCRDQTNQRSILEWLRPDLGGPSHHLVRKAHRRFELLAHSGAYRAALERGEFRLVFLTATAEKAAAIHAATQLHQWLTGTAIHLAVIPQLLKLQTRYQHGS